LEDCEFVVGGVQQPVRRDSVAFVEGTFEDYVGGAGGGGEDLDGEERWGLEEVRAGV
jgi:hypothetical protein